MHPLRVLMLVSLAIAAAVAFAFGSLLMRADVAPGAAIVLGILVFGAFLMPWAGVTAWALRRAGDLDRLTDRTRRIIGGDYDTSILDRRYHGELDELARAIEETRAILVRQRATFEEHQAAFEQIAASLGEGLLAVNARGRVVFANARVSELFGGREPLVGSSFLEVVRRQSVVDAFDLALHGQASSGHITLGNDPDERQIEIRVFPVERSAEMAAVALFIDITKIERLQRIRRDFLDDFSHEVRTPLAGLRSAVETFDHGALTDEQEAQLRSVMLRQLGRIERLVQDLSELNRIESGELVLDRRAVDLHLVLGELVEDFRERLRSTPVTLTLRGDSAVASADATRVQQIFANLIDNAWKHGARQGEILVEVARDDGQAVVRISDEGEGIPPHELDRIFNRFYRVDKSRSQNVPGVGLGLSIAKHLVLLHGGSIAAFNRATGGATFEVRLPAA